MKIDTWLCTVSHSCFAECMTFNDKPNPNPNPNLNPNPNPYTTLNQKPNDNLRSYFMLLEKSLQEQLLRGQILDHRFAGH